MEGFPNGMRFRLDLGGSKEIMNEKPTVTPSKADMKPRIAAAKEYLESHQLEVRLSEAMMAVLRERPEDPAQFIAKRLASTADCGVPGDIGGTALTVPKLRLPKQEK